MKQAFLRIRKLHQQAASTTSAPSSVLHNYHENLEHNQGHGCLFSLQCDKQLGLQSTQTHLKNSPFHQQLHQSKSHAKLMTCCKPAKNNKWLQRLIPKTAQQRSMARKQLVVPYLDVVNANFSIIRWGWQNSWSPRRPLDIKIPIVPRRYFTKHLQ